MKIQQVHQSYETVFKTVFQIKRMLLHEEPYITVWFPDKGIAWYDLRFIILPFLWKGLSLYNQGLSFFLLSISILFYG